jgi:hypothetical protein
MRTFFDGIMTRVSRFSVHAAIALALFTGCADHVQVTSLDGDIACGSLTCGGGQLCKAFEPHPNEPLQYSCATVPAACDVFDCVSDDRSCGDDGCEICPTCVSNLCGYLTRVEGRELTCLGF